MRVDLDKERSIIIRWEYDGPMTMCHIENVQQAILASSIISRHYKDRNDKEKARRITLKRVLLKYYPSTGVLQKTNYEIRKKVWEAYRTMTKKPRW